ncbi:MAG: neutral zinc metallopeptidase [Gemmatimonadaceae bacterium]
MWNRIIARGRTAAIGLIVVALSAGSTREWSSAAFAHADDDPVRIALTARDIEASTTEAAAAHGALASMWTNELRRVGAPFRTPRLVRYRGNARTACGIMPANNAAYCLNNNTIYFDDVFLAAQAKLASHALGTDGDMAAVGIIAHEMGHAVAFQLGYQSRSSYANERAADCLAGAFARHAERDGSLEDGDVEEAFFAMAAAADPEFQPTGNSRVDSRRQARLSRQAHGTRAQRQSNFREGLERGPKACVPGL